MSSIMTLLIFLADDDTLISALSVAVAFAGVVALLCIAYIVFALIQRRKSNKVIHISGMYTCTGVDKGYDC